MIGGTRHTIQFGVFFSFSFLFFLFLSFFPPSLLLRKTTVDRELNLGGVPCGGGRDPWRGARKGNKKKERKKEKKIRLNNKKNSLSFFCSIGKATSASATSSA